MRNLVADLTAQRVVPVLRGTDPSMIDRVVDALVEGGMRLVELTMTSPDAIADLRRTRQRHPDLLLGMGTVVTEAQVAEVTAAGADFLVTPIARPDVISRASEDGVPTVGGAMTPTEVAAMHDAGAGAVKVFPAGRLGAGYLGDVRAVLPDVALVPTGGIGEADVGAYLERGAVAVGIGSSLTGLALAGDTDALAGLAGRAHHLIERWTQA